jgi:transposase
MRQRNRAVWIGWARRCRIATFVDLQRRIVKHKASILAAIEHGLSNERASHCTFYRGSVARGLVALAVA